MDPHTVNNILFSAAIGIVLLIALLIEGLDRLRGYREREETRRHAACNVKLAEQAVQHMWRRVNDMGLEGIDQAIFVCCTLTEIQQRYGCHPQANVLVKDSKGNPNFLCIGSK